MKSSEPPVGDEMKDRRVLQAWERLRSDPKLTIKELAQNVGLSESRLQHLIPEQIGMSVRNFKELQRTDRLHTARRRILESHIPITAIRIDAGYTHESNFIRDFKSLFGITPAKCRRGGK